MSAGLEVAEKKLGRRIRTNRSGMLLYGKPQGPGIGLAFNRLLCPGPGEQHNGGGFTGPWRPAGNRLRGCEGHDGRQQANGCASAHEDSMAGGRGECKPETLSAFKGLSRRSLAQP